MNLMVIGSGGREHAIIKQLKKNTAVETVYALPGNGGMTGDAVCVPIAPKEHEAVIAFAKSHRVGYAVVAPDDPLVDGLVNSLEEAGIPCFGPRKEAAILEGSKVFAKDLMKRYNIPTAAYEVFSSADEALSYIEASPLPAVIKADGLALGKGVIIAETREAAREAVKSIMEDKKFGKSGDKIVVEEFLTGPEVSVLAFTDGHTLVPMISSMDHKRVGDGDKGPNTGGMGTIAPNPYYTKAVADECMERIFLPTIRAMREEGRPFKGCLYFGLMLTKDGPKVIEYNCRFGDPETQVVLPLLESDLFSVMQAVTEERLSSFPVTFSDKHACCVIMASQGYPGSFDKGFAIDILPSTLPHVYAAGVSEQDGVMQTAGGRVLGVTAVAASLREAIDEAYRLVDTIHFDKAYYRKDIGQRALKAGEVC